MLAILAMSWPQSAKPAAIQDLAGQIAKLPALTGELIRQPAADWLVVPHTQRTGVYRGDREFEIVMTNGLISRTWRLKHNAATVGFDNLVTQQTILRGVKPEAILELDDTRYEVGGLVGQPDYAYLRRDWLDAMAGNDDAFQFERFDVGKTTERFAWTRSRYSPTQPWPAPGASLVLHFRSSAGNHSRLEVSVHYEMYDGLPVIAKWLVIRNGGTKAVKLKGFVNEILAVVEAESLNAIPQRWELPNIHVESEYAFHGMDPKAADKTTHWLPDPQYSTQVNFALATPALLEVRPPMGPDAIIQSGRQFETFRTYELLWDSTDRERKGLALRRMYRTLAPWVAENPIQAHLTKSDPASVRMMVDQCAEVGFELVILSFGSGFSIENADPEYIRQIKELADYSRSRGIDLGGYTRLTARRISPEGDGTISPKTGKPGSGIFGHSPCLGGQWAMDWFRKSKTFLVQTGLAAIGNDGSYPGDVCASTTHPGHRGLEDSQWNQWLKVIELYRWCRARGIYLRVPDWYIFSGANQVGMGYREENWSLPRERQILLARQNIYDGTWKKPPSMGWMFVPLVEYHGGGAAATLEPLGENLDAYAAHLAQNFGAGVQAMYRGPRLYDTEKTRAVVKSWVDFYRKYRPILDSDIIHVRRPDGRDIDCILHVNSRLKQKGLAMVYNPLNHRVVRSLKLPLYYTGLTTFARISERGSNARTYALDRHFNVELHLDMAPGSVTWYVVESGVHP